MNFRLFLMAFCFGVNAFAAPNIVVSIKPLYGIVSELTRGVATPTLLIKNQASAHHFHLRPSQLSQLNTADLIVFVHPDFETGFKKILSSIKNDKKITLSQESSNHHLWLDVDLIIKFSKNLSKKLIEIDSENQSIYTANLDALTQKLHILKANIKQQLAPHKHRKIVSFSNAFLYFLNANALENSLVISHYHGARLSLFKIINTRKFIKKSKTTCLLSTPQVPNKSIQTLVENLDINTESIDIIGDGDYFKLINSVTHQVSQCLK